MINIPLTHGRFALIDDEDYKKASKWRWRVIQNRYVEGRRLTNQKENIRLHRLILDAPKDMDVDHIDYDGFNNQKSNLRLCTTAQNIQRQRPQTRSKTSRHRGVFWDKSRNRWTAKVRKCGKDILIGRFKTEIEAVKIWNEKAKELFGEYAYINILTN